MSQLNKLQEDRLRWRALSAGFALLDQAANAAEAHR